MGSSFKGFSKADFAKFMGKGIDTRMMVRYSEPHLKVWVGNLAEGTTWKELQEHMNQAGATKWVEVFEGKGKGTAAVAYATEEEAAAAITVMNGSELKGAALLC